MPLTSREGDYVSNPCCPKLSREWYDLGCGDVIACDPFLRPKNSANYMSCRLKTLSEE